MNSDGFSLGNPGLAGRGGLIRNDKGEWIRGYARAIGSTTSAAVELWCIKGWHSTLHSSEFTSSGV
ncbi:hypothetical protein SO802_018682 [Lithocarpus litseifolius]|uniref:RNase H type-1 domain-containing protein n=1 Tax=Lithocarpus litseifolius TaxID=425828 RepID=A0AAW2CQQ5_9ROSI